MASPTVTLVTAAPNPAVAGQSVTLTATVIPLGAGTPTGTVTFVVGGGPTLTGTLSGGTTSVTVPNLTLGTHIVTATYNGDVNFTSSTGTTAVVVIQASTTTSVISAPDPSTLGQPVTFTATVTPVAPGAGVPTGSVTFIIGGSGAVRSSSRCRPARRRCPSAPSASAHTPWSPSTAAARTSWRPPAPTPTR